MTEYDIFREELAIKYPGYGHALWEPSPPVGACYPAVQIGDVGFIRRGSFHRLFNALLPEDDESHRGGVPPHHKPLEIRMSPPTRMGTLMSNNFRSKGVSAGLEIHQTLPDHRSFLCSRERGAVLYLPVSAQREDTEALGEFGKYMIKHIDQWFAFARERGAGINRREDIVLVTGRDLARSWANIAFQDKDERVSFEAKVLGDSHVEWTFTPEGAGGVACNCGPSGKDLPVNQCIFIRGFRATRIAMILPWLRAAAGPAQTPDEEDLDPDSDTQLLSFPSDTRYQEPFYTLLKYIALQAPECDMALIHDNDLLCIDGASLDSLQPDPLMTYLRQSAPKVWELGYDCSPSDKGASIAEPPPQAAVTRVAALSNFDMAVTPEPMVTHNDHNIIPFPSQPSTLTFIFDEIKRSIAKLSPSTLEKLGDQLLERAREVCRECEYLISHRDLYAIEVKITHARDIKAGLESKWGVSRFLQAKEYHRSAKHAYRFAKVLSDRRSPELFSQLQGTSPAPVSGERGSEQVPGE